MIRAAHTPTSRELDDGSTISSSDIEDAKRTADRDDPAMRPAFRAEVIPVDEQYNRPLADESPDGE